MGVSDGLPSIVELLRVLVNILDPHDRIHTDSTRLLALGVLNTSFEVSGPRLGDFPTLRTMVLGLYVGSTCTPCNGQVKSPRDASTEEWIILPSSQFSAFSHLQP